MKRVAMVFVSALTALMFSVPASADSYVTFDDKPDDLGHPVYIYHDPAEDQWPAAYWPEASPVGGTGYLDMLGGSMGLGEDGLMVTELELVAGLTDESTLPQGVKAVWYTWFFSKDTSIIMWADYAIHVCWDGGEVSAMDGFLVVRGVDDPMRSLSSCYVTENVVHVEFNGDLVDSSVAWFAETICWNHSTPEIDEQGFMPSAGWFAADITDGPFLPWQPMPS